MKRDSINRWPVIICQSCGLPFGQEAGWMQNCVVCYKESNGQAILKGDFAFARLQEEVSRLQKELKEKKKNPAPTPEQADFEKLTEEFELKNEEVSKLHKVLEDARIALSALQFKVESAQTIEAALKATISSMRKDIQERDDRVKILVEEIARLKKALEQKIGSIPTPQFSKEFKRKLLLLCHPDVNPSKQSLATEVTQWILSRKTLD